MCLSWALVCLRCRKNHSPNSASHPDILAIRGDSFSQGAAADLGLVVAARCCVAFGQEQPRTRLALLGSWRLNPQMQQTLELCLCFCCILLGLGRKSLKLRVGNDDTCFCFLSTLFDTFQVLQNGTMCGSPCPHPLQRASWTSSPKTWLGSDSPWLAAASAGEGTSPRLLAMTHARSGIQLRVAPIRVPRSYTAPGARAVPGSGGLAPHDGSCRTPGPARGPLPRQPPPRPAAHCCSATSKSSCRVEKPWGLGKLEGDKKQAWLHCKAGWSSRQS